MPAPHQFDSPLAHRFLSQPSGENQQCGLDELIDDVRRNVEVIMNSRLPVYEDFFLSRQKDLVDQSVANFGILDFHAVVTDDDNERQRFERSIVLAIQRYEPRLQRVEIQVVTSRENRVLTLEINAKLNVKPVEDVEFRSTLEISRNFFSVTSS